VAHVFVVDGGSDWYASSQPAETRSLYAEWEPTRALPGELSLPVGSYAVRIFLTEESFHENAASPPSGRWATVMIHDDIRFAISPPPACSDGLDNDGDELIDFPDDPGCNNPSRNFEDPQCQDGVNNDPGQDPDPGLIDFDGGLSALGYVVSDPDPQCVDAPWRNKESAGPCGLGSELALILPGLMWLHRRRRRLH
jgi:hypothetical protein